MERIQSRRRINAGNTQAQENDALAARIAAKPAVPKPAARTVLGDVGNRNIGPKVNALKKPLQPATKPVVASTRTVFGVNQKKPVTLLKPILRKPKVPASKALPTQTTTTTKSLQIRKEGSAEDVKPMVPSIKHKDIAKAISAGQVIRRTSESEIVKGIYDVDLETDPELVSEYVNDIMKYLLELECKYPISKKFLEGHKVTEKFRAVLVNWLAEVTDSFKLLRETFHMSISIIDRYLEKNRGISKDNLQLVGIVAMYIAHKYEQTNCNDLEDFVYICDSAFSKQQILSMEVDMLKKMDFALGRPTAICFLRRFNKVANATERQHGLGKLFIELALMECEFSSVAPSMQAAAACCLTRWLTEPDGAELASGWNELLAFYCGYTFKQIEAVVRRYAAMVVRSESVRQQTIRNIHAEAKNHRISKDELLRSDRLKELAATVS